MRPRLKISGKTDKGKKRQKNEDFFQFDSELGYMVVADGMGGHASGEVASKLATTVMTEQLKISLQTGHVPVFFHVEPKPNLDPRSLILGDCVKVSNLAVFEAAHNNPENHNMGTTLVAALWLEDKLSIAHVGDSRLYHIHEGKMKQMTTDHSFVQEQVNRGLMKPEDAEKSDMKNMLTRSIGISEDVDVDIKEISLDPGDYVLLCSDGLTKMLNDQTIMKAFQEGGDPNEVVDRLIKWANDAGGGDNITVVVAYVDGPSSKWGSLTDRIKKVFKKNPLRN